MMTPEVLHPISIFRLLGAFGIVFTGAAAAVLYLMARLGGAK